MALYILRHHAGIYTRFSFWGCVLAVAAMQLFTPANGSATFGGALKLLVVVTHAGA